MDARFPWDERLSHVLYLDQFAESAPEIAAPLAALGPRVAQGRTEVTVETALLRIGIRRIHARDPLVCPWETEIAPNWRVAFALGATPDPSRPTECWSPASIEVVSGVVALLTAFPAADAFLVVHHDIPALMRRHGRLVLAQALAYGGGLWDPDAHPYRAMVRLDHAVESLGPW
ncbi:SitI3 family protein [Methylobacterium oryzisoli]|uniref:SitI3 family protein n=1 Tax=Methylobacterium oryzisoli TaxID=3385502 RepID=UPI003891CE87